MGAGNLRKKTYVLALGGVFLAASVVCLVLASVVPGVELTLYAVSSIFVAVMVLESGIGAGVLLYAGTLLLGLAIVPSKLALVPYAVFFGLYAFIKYYGEKPRNPVVQLAAKGAFFLVVLTGATLAFGSLVSPALGLEELPWPLLFGGGLVFFYLYDYILTLLISLYRRRVSRSERDFPLSRDKGPD